MGKRLVDPDKLCMGCMAEVGNTQAPCPRCGFMLKNYKQPAGSMPPKEIVNGKYLIGQVIGVGGFGITYIAWDFYQSKRVCIKEYFPRGVASRGQDASTSTQYSVDVFTVNTRQARTAYLDGLHSYIKEAETLSHFYMMPGVVSVRDFFYGNQTAYIVMEYIEGINLKKLAKQNGGRLSPEFLFPVLQDVLKALDAVHKAGVIHRDISPDNIMLSRNYQAKVIDFGAARVFHGDKEYAVLLKHGYAPIEQYDRNGNQGPWTDVYSMSASIYYLLGGKKLPRSYERDKAVREQGLQDPLLPLRAYGVNISPAQEAALMKGLSIQIQDRYSSMGELYQALYYEPMVNVSRDEAAMSYLRQQMNKT